MVVKDVETGLTGANLIRALLNDEFGYNHVCECGVEQTYDGCKTMLKTAIKKGTTIEHDFVCANCRKCRPCTVFGVTYKSVKEAAEKSYDVEKCRCEVCNNPFTQEQWYQWCQRYSEENDGHLVCHSCKSSQVRIALNERDHDKLSQQIRERNLKNWQDPEYYEKHAHQMSEVSKKTWESDERKYGVNKDLTFREAHALALESDETKISTFVKRTRFAADTAFTDDQKIALILDAVDDLHKKYLGRYQNITISDPDIVQRNIKMKEDLVRLDIKHDLYFNYVKTFKSSTNKGHHVIPTSIESHDEYVVDLDPQDHLIAHFFLFLDNFTRSQNEELNKDKNFKISKMRFQIFLALTYVFGYALKNVRNQELIEDLHRIMKPIKK